MSSEGLYFSLSNDIYHIIIMYVVLKNTFEKRIFSLLFFEHGYLSNNKQCILDI